MKKRSLALLLALVLLLALAACGDQAQPFANGAEEPRVSLTIDTLKIGLILIGDEADGYNKTYVDAMKDAMKALGIPAEQLQIKANVPSGADREAAGRALAEAGCQVIFFNGFDPENDLLRLAAAYPKVQFCLQATADDAENTHAYSARSYEAHYLSGIAAGLKTETNKLGYVAAKDYPAVISGFSAFYLGAKSVNPDVELYVKYTHEWNAPAQEALTAQALIDQGCDVIGQHSDSTAPVITAQNAGVFAVGYSKDRIPLAPKAALTSACIDWSVYYHYALACLLSGEAIAQNWCEGLESAAVYLSKLNKAIVAPGTNEAVETAKKALLDGSRQVFAGPLYDQNGALLLQEGEVFPPEEAAPAPIWDKILEGINVLS